MDTPVMPVMLLIGGSYLAWFGVHYWRDQALKWPSDPVKSVVTGKGVPTPQPAATVSSQLTSAADKATSSSGGVVPAPGPGIAGKGGWDPVRASSYWGSHTASGHAMTATTIASPYLPIGTQVDVTYNGKTVMGTVDDFGPADWVLRADPQRFLDLATPMMSQLSGQGANLITCQYQVTTYGTGPVFRPNHPMTARLKSRWTGV